MSECGTVSWEISYGAGSSFSDGSLPPFLLIYVQRNDKQGGDQRGGCRVTGNHAKACGEQSMFYAFARASKSED